MVYNHIYSFVFVVDVSFKGKNSIKITKMSLPEYKDFFIGKITLLEILSAVKLFPLC